MHFSSDGQIPIWVYFNVGVQIHGNYRNRAGTTALSLTRHFINALLR